MRLRHCLLVLVSVPGLLMLSPLTIVYGRQASIMNEASNIKDAPRVVEQASTAQEASSIGEASRVAEKPEAAKSIDEARPPAPVPTPLELSRVDKTYEAAYKDTYNILSEDNSCSNFYGGPDIAVMVFNELVGQLRTEYDRDPKVGIVMTTPVTTVDDMKTGHSYRLFASAKLNRNGPFYQSHIAPTDKLMPGIGAFQANTREARALMLLHELGHLMKGPDQQWLLPDDGDNPLLSSRNTKTVEAHCAKQIRDLGDGISGAKVMAGKKLFERAAERATIIRPGSDKPASQ